MTIWQKLVSRIHEEKRSRQITGCAVKEMPEPKKVVIEHSYIRYREFPALKVQMVILHEARFSNDHILIIQEQYRSHWWLSTLLNIYRKDKNSLDYEKL